MHLHSALQQNEFQSNLPNVFTKDHLAGSQRVSSGVWTCGCSQGISRNQRAGLLSWSRGEAGLCDAARRHTRLRIIGCQVLIHTEACLPQVCAAISQKGHGRRVSDLSKTGVPTQFRKKKEAE